MKKLLIPIVIIVLIIVLFTSYYLKKENNVCINNSCFEVELAKTDRQRAQGLMFRESLDSNKGMLFIFDSEEKHSFWMKNTLIPLDIIYINSNSEVVHIANALPCEQEPCESIVPSKKAKYVLEINYNLTKELRISVGDNVEIN